MRAEGAEVRDEDSPGPTPESSQRASSVPVNQVSMNVVRKPNEVKRNT